MSNSIHLQNTKTQYFSHLGKLGGALLKLPMLFADIPFLTFSARITPSERQKMLDLLQAGDIVLTADRLFSTWQFIMKTFWNSSYTHAAVYEGNGHIIEATTFHPSGDGVARTDAEHFLSGYKSICILRPPYGSGKNRNDAVSFAVSQLGNPYDYALNNENNGAMYCSKLAAKSLLSSGITVSPRRLCGFLWKHFYIPDDLVKIEGMTMIYGVPKRQRKIEWNYILPIACFVLLTAAQIPFVCILVLLAVVALAGWLQLTSVKTPLSENNGLEHLLIKKSFTHEQVN